MGLVDAAEFRSREVERRVPVDGYHLLPAPSLAAGAVPPVEPAAPHVGDVDARLGIDQGGPGADHPGVRTAARQ